MLYYLFDYLNKLNVPGAGMFTYISFRSLLAVLIALLVSTVFGKHFIAMLRAQQITETQRDASVDPFGVQKIGIPTIKVQWQTAEFQTRIKTFTGFSAQIIQHEVDHCDGVLI